MSGLGVPTASHYASEGREKRRAKWERGKNSGSCVFIYRNTEILVKFRVQGDELADPG